MASVTVPDGGGRDDVVSKLKPDWWPFATDEERAEGWATPEFDRRQRRRRSTDKWPGFVSNTGSPIPGDRRRPGSPTPASAVLAEALTHLGEWPAHDRIEPQRYRIAADLARAIEAAGYRIERRP